MFRNCPSVEIRKGGLYCEGGWTQRIQLEQCLRYYLQMMQMNKGKKDWSVARDLDCVIMLM